MRRCWVITKINLKNFKCFDLLKLPVAPLTLLSGSNASGKSSVIQSLILLHQTIIEHEWSTRIMLNGHSLKLGAVADVVDKVHGRKGFEIGLETEDAIVNWQFSGERDELSLKVHNVECDGQNYDSPEKLQYLLPESVSQKSTSVAKLLKRATYITAERIGPREFYYLEDKQNTLVVGPAGEHAISLLHSGRDENVLYDLILDQTPPTRLRQVEARMNEFFPGCGMVVEQVPKMNAVTLGLRTSDATDFHRPVHVGFGLTQVLPIIIAALSAEVGDILLIENPEVHLHPAGQALMGRFLADVSRAGIQVIVESHSDHVLNGIRRAVRDKRISNEDVVLHFFMPRNADKAQVRSPMISPTGNIDEWPEGFFDQFDKDLNYFAGWES